MAEVVFSVSQITEYIHRKLNSDVFLCRVSVVGEVTNFGVSSIGHAFFSLKDENAMIGCIVYDFETNEETRQITDGALVTVTGRVLFYKKSGTLQLCVEKAGLQGMGDLYARFEQTKQKLWREGLFDMAHKKPLPALPLRIGVVTSAAGAALQDILQVSQRRFPGIGIAVYPALVQGKDAARQVCSGIEYFNRKKNVDVIIVARGGGSFEDLFAFNEECVARAVYSSQIPVVSAVGHETDYTLCDMAADLRAPTPSAAAELVVREKQEVVAQLDEWKKDMLLSLRGVLLRSENQTRLLAGGIRAYPFRLHMQQATERIAHQRERMKKGLNVMLGEIERCVLEQRRSIENLSPKSVLGRGYAIVFGEDGGVINSARAAGGAMEIEFADGRVPVVRKDAFNG